MRPNVLLVVMDTARADAFEPHGAPAGSTPALAQLAVRGRVVDPPHATACWTLPSHASMFTGLLPRAAGLSRAPGGRPEGAGPILRGHANRLLPEVMRRAGYATGAVSTNLWISRASGFDTGFEDFVYVDGPRQWMMHGTDLRSRGHWLRQSLRARVDDGAKQARDTLLGWTRHASPERPFFWFVNLVECHSPYLPPRPYNDLGPAGRLRAGEEARRNLNLGAIWHACVTRTGISERALERMRHLYARSVRYMDDWLSAVLEGLDARGLLDETVVVVTSDHGENFGEGGQMGHAFSLDERLLRVPFVLAGPGAAEVRAPISLAELPRVVADLAGLADHPWQSTDAVAGDAVALAQFDPPAARDHPRAIETAERWELDEEGITRLTSALDCATASGVKVVRRDDGEQVFDLGRDPLEADPVGSRADPATVARLTSALDAVQEDAPVAVPAPDGADPRGDISDEERRRLEDRMRLLGYL